MSGGKWEMGCEFEANLVVLKALANQLGKIKK